MATLRPLVRIAGQTKALPTADSLPEPWVYLVLGSDFVTNSATAVDITGLSFAPAANLRYLIEAQLMLRTATTTVGPRTGVAWPTGTTDGVANLLVPTSGTAQVLAFGNPAGALLAAVGGLPNTTGSYPSNVMATLVMGASPAGSFRLQMASETAGTNVTVRAGSWMRYRKI